jgi:hypothetical protein
MSTPQKKREGRVKKRKRGRGEREGEEVGECIQFGYLR